MSKTKILIFDTEQAIEDHYPDLLLDSEHEVIYVDPEEGLHKQIKRLQPDVVILNMHHPEVDDLFSDKPKSVSARKPRAIFHNGQLTIDVAARCVRLGSHRVRLTPTEFSLLAMLTQHAGQVLTHEALCAALHTQTESSTHLLHVHISNLRRKIEANPSSPHFILTEPGIGYMLNSEYPVQSPS